MSPSADFPVFKFDRKPDFASLWEACVYTIYDEKAFARDLEGLFSSIGIDKNSKIVDSAAGSGFPAIELFRRGYNIECIDKMQDETSAFNERTKRLDLELKCKKATWLSMPRLYGKEAFDLLFCRGNSIHFAGGGWNRNNGSATNRDKSLEMMRKTVRSFYSVIKPGGYFYLDKFYDDEKPSKVKVADVLIGDRHHDLLFYREIKRKEGYRIARMILRDDEGNEQGAPNVTYPITFKELKEILAEEGFEDVRDIKLDSETHFGVLLARRPA